MSDTPLEYESDNLIVGSAELTAVRTRQGICWAIPGGRVECSREVAIEHAVQLDRMISHNLTKYSRKLFR